MRGQAEFSELHTLGTFAQAPKERLVGDDVLKEKFPLNLEGVVTFAGRDFFPAFIEVDGAVDIGVPDGDGGVFHGLSPTLAQADDSRSFGAIDLHDEEVVATHAHVPRGVELAEDAGLGLKHGVSGVVGGALVRLAVFAEALGNMSGGVAEDFGDFAKKIIDHIAPVAVHIDDDAATVFATVVPRGTLGRVSFVVPRKDPVAEFATNTEDVAEKTFFLELFESHDAGEPELVLHRAVFDSCFLSDFGNGEGFVVFGGGGLFAIDVLASSDGFFEKLNAVRGARGVEENLVVRICQCGIKVGGVTFDSVFFSQGFDFFCIAPSEDGIGHDGDVATLDAALLADGEDGADEVLIGAHASGDAVHDDADFFSHSVWCVESRKGAKTQNF